MLSSHRASHDAATDNGPLTADRLLKLAQRAGEIGSLLHGGSVFASFGCRHFLGRYLLALRDAQVPMQLSRPFDRALNPLLYHITSVRESRESRESGELASGVERGLDGSG